MVNSLAFVIWYVCPYLSEFVSQHVTAALWLRREKEKRNRKWHDSWKGVAGGEEHWWLTNDKAKRGISDHRTSLDAQPSGWRELRTTKGPLFMSTASGLRRQRKAKAKLMEPDL